MNYSDEFKKILNKLIDKNQLSFDDSKLAFEIIMSGEATDSQISSLLTCVSMQGHDSTIISAGAEIMRKKCIKIPSNDQNS